MRKIYAAFLCVALAVMALPCALMPFVSSLIGAENRLPAEMPVLADENGLNFSFPAQYEDWLNDHIALRKLFITEYANMLRFMGTSPQDQVILGRDGWLFFRKTLDDYTGENAFSGDEIARIALMLDTIDATLRAQGSCLIVAIAPNKASIYPEYMNAAYPQNQNAGNAERVMQSLHAVSVPLFDILRGHAAEGVYFHTDTHWNALGARYAANAILSALADETGTPIALPDTGASYELIADWPGDLSRMLNPYTNEREAQQHYGERHSFQYKGRARSPEALMISTKGGQAPLKILVLRDSFCNLLLDDISAAIGEVTYLRAMPLPLTELEGIDAVVFEMAERRLKELLDKPPVIRAVKAGAPERLNEAALASSHIEVEVTRDGARISGWLDREPGRLSEALLGIRTEDEECWYVAMPVSGLDGHTGQGFSALLNALPEDAMVRAFMEGDDMTVVSEWKRAE